MAPGLCEKSLQDAEEGLTCESLLQEQKTHFLKDVPSHEELTGTAQEEAHLLERNRNVEIKPKQTEEQERIKLPQNKHETREERMCDIYAEKREERRPLDEEEGGIGRCGGKGGEEPGGGGDKTRERGNRNDCSERGDSDSHKNCFQRYRDLVAYWCLGFCNNFTYWVMITAAYDLLTPEFQAYHERAQAETHETIVHANEETTEREQLYGVLTLSDIESTTIYAEPNRHNESLHEFVNTFECQKHSTGVILVADTLPATALSLAVPLTLMLPVNTRVWLVSLLCGASYLTLGLAHPKWVFLGVAFASASRGFSDSTFLGHASHFHKHVLSMWSSGTGVATFMGPLLYSSLTTGGLDPRHVLLIFLAIPIITAASFWCLLSRYEEESGRRDRVTPDEVARLKSSEDGGSEKQKLFIMIQEKLTLFMRAQKYIVPLSVFYLIMYTTNQGLLELVYFPASIFTHAQQYSWSNTVRCLGTLISRSAHHFMLLPSSWIYVCLALAILCVVGTEAHYHYLPSEYIVFTLLLLQGLVEGAAFRSSMFNIHNKTTENDRKFCLAVFPTSLFLPALVAGLISMPLHEVLCQNHMYKA